MFLNNCISRLVQIMVGTLHVLAQGHRPEHSVEDQDDCQDQELSELVDLGPVPEDLLPVCLVVDPGIFGVLSASEPGPEVGRKQMADEELVLVLLDAVLHASGEKKRKEEFIVVHSIIRICGGYRTHLGISALSTKRIKSSLYSTWRYVW